MNNLRSILSVLAILVAAMAFTGCGGEDKKAAAKSPDPDKVPTVTSHDVQTVISDSGRTRYRITAKLWNIYSEAKTPHWTFPNGLVADELDQKFHNVASLICDSAYYDMKNKKWSAIGNVRLSMRSGDRILCERMYYDENIKQINCMDSVRITRVGGDKILTNQMFYETTQRRTHGDTFIHIEGGGRIIEGYGYEYLDTDKSYTITQVQGIFPIDDSRFRGRN